MWPIYFYHDGSREWIKMKQIVYRFDGPEYIDDIEKSYNHRLFKKRVPNPEKEWVSDKVRYDTQNFVHAWGRFNNFNIACAFAS